jgi:hypothetical protein
MEAEIEQLESWYQKQLENIRKHAENMYAKMSARQKKQNQVSIGNWVRTQSQHLANYREQCLLSIKSKWMKSDKKAVLVGINYTGTQNELKGCVNDVYKIRGLLVSRFDYRHENIKLLLDNEATRANILDEFTNLVQNAQEGDHICFTFSGHGYFQSDLYNPDENDGKDEVIVSVDNLAIVDDEFKEILQKRLKNKVTMFAMFDSCHSGSILDLRYQYFHDNENNEKIDPHSLDTPGQVILLSGCKDNQTSIDAYIGKKFDGVLTWAFVETLSIGDGKGTWDGLLKQIRKIMTDNKMEQIPQLSSGRHMNVLTEQVML